MKPTATATENFVALEHHSLDVPWWDSLVTRVDGKPLFDHGFAPASDAPGLGVEPNEAVIREHLRPGTGYFEPTPQYDDYILDRFRRGGPYPHIDENGKLVTSM